MSSRQGEISPNKRCFAFTQKNMLENYGNNQSVI
jgi:hypothetical protein